MATGIINPSTSDGSLKIKSIKQDSATTTDNIYIANAGRHILITLHSSTGMCSMHFVNANSTGTVSIKTIVAGDDISFTTSTNTLTATHNSSTITYVDFASDSLPISFIT